MSALTPNEALAWFQAFLNADFLARVQQSCEIDDARVQASIDRREAFWHPKVFRPAMRYRPSSWDPEKAAEKAARLDQDYEKPAIFLHFATTQSASIPNNPGIMPGVPEGSILHHCIVSYWEPSQAAKTFSSLYSAMETPEGLKMLTDSVVCFRCFATGAKEGATCPFCEGRGWTDRTEYYLFSDANPILWAHPIAPPHERYLPAFRAFPKFTSDPPFQLSLPTLGQPEDIFEPAELPVFLRTTTPLHREEQNPSLRIVQAMKRAPDPIREATALALLRGLETASTDERFTLFFALNFDCQFPTIQDHLCEMLEPVPPGWLKRIRPGLQSFASKLLGVMQLAFPDFGDPRFQAAARRLSESFDVEFDVLRMATEPIGTYSVTFVAETVAANLSWPPSDARWVGREFAYNKDLSLLEQATRAMVPLPNDTKEAYVGGVAVWMPERVAETRALLGLPETPPADPPTTP